MGLIYDTLIKQINSDDVLANLTDRGIEAEVVAPIMAEVELVGAVLVQGTKRMTIGHLAGSYQGSTPGSASARVEWVVEKTAPNATVRITVISEKGGTVRTGQITF